MEEIARDVARLEDELFAPPERRKALIEEMRKKYEQYFIGGNREQWSWELWYIWKAIHEFKAGNKQGS